MAAISLLLLLLSFSLISLANPLSSCPSCSLQECIQAQSPNASFLLPGDDGYDDARVGVNVRYDQGYPDVILQVADVNDIIAAVTCARQLDVAIFVMNGGHSFEGLSTADAQKGTVHMESRTTLLLHLDNFSQVTAYDNASHTITVQSGMRLGRLYGNVIQYGGGQWVIGAGTDGTVGVTGHTLCGGYGMLGRYVGFTSDQVVAFRIVNAEGNLVLVDAKQNSDIFWALRGGCSSAFGIVTHVTFRLTYIPSPYMTIIYPPSIFGLENVTQTLLWFQEYAPLAAPRELTGTVTCGNMNAALDFTFVGSKREAVAATLPALVAGLGGILTYDEIYASYVEGTYLDAVLHWSGYTSLDQLLSVQSLPPLSDRTSRRKAVSLQFYSSLAADGVATVLTALSRNEISYFEWKAYGGTNPLAAASVWDARSPLRRGCQYEMHMSNSYASPVRSSPTNDPTDEAMVETVLNVSRSLYPFIKESYPQAFTSYIDLDLGDAGEAYYGRDNKERMIAIRTKDLANSRVFSSPASALLYPIQKRYVFVGAFSDSISTWTFDDKSGQFTYVTQTVLASPAWMGFSPDGTMLYASSETSDYNGTFSGTLTSYRVSCDGRLEVISQVTSGCANPDCATLDRFMSHVYSSHSCGNSTMVSTHPGVSRTDTCNSTGPYLHQVVLDEASGFSFVTDLMMDVIYVYEYAPSTGLLSVDPIHTIALATGSGPRHMVIHPTLPYAFLVSEYANTLTTLAYQKSTGLLKVVHVISTLRVSEQNDTSDFGAAEIHLSSGGEYLYVSNRDLSQPSLNRSSIAVFRLKIDPSNLNDVTPVPIQHIDSGGQHPRHFSLSKNGDFLLVANRDTSTLASFSVDKNSGFLSLLSVTPVGSYIQSPAFIQMVDVACE